MLTLFVFFGGRTRGSELLGNELLSTLTGVLFTLVERALLSFAWDINPLLLLLSLLSLVIYGEYVGLGSTVFGV